MEPSDTVELMMCQLRNIVVDLDSYRNVKDEQNQLFETLMEVIQIPNVFDVLSPCQTEIKHILELILPFKDAGRKFLYYLLSQLSEIIDKRDPEELNKLNRTINYCILLEK